MKNREDLIIMAGTAISDFAKITKGGFDLFFVDGDFLCREKCTSAEMAFFVRHISRNQCNYGLTSSQWLSLGRIAVRFSEAN